MNAAEINLVPPAQPTGFETLSYQGKTYRTVPIEPEELIVAMEERLRSLRADPMSDIKEQLKSLEGMPEMQEKLLKMAYEESRDKRKDAVVSQSEIMRFMDSREGLTYVVFLSLKKSHPEMTEELATKIVLNQHISALAKRADQLNRDGIIKAAQDKAKLAAAEKGE